MSTLPRKIEPLPRTRHRVVIEFDIDVAPELANKLRQRLETRLYGFLGYPSYALSVDYSYNHPEPPDEVSVEISSLEIG